MGRADTPSLTQQVSRVDRRDGKGGADDGSPASAGGVGVLAAVAGAWPVARLKARANANSDWANQNGRGATKLRAAVEERRRPNGGARREADRKLTWIEAWHRLNGRCDAAVRSRRTRRRTRGLIAWSRHQSACCVCHAPASSSSPSPQEFGGRNDYSQCG